MTRAKVKLAYITNEAARKATFKKRKKGLMKKMGELATLCGIEACAIVFGSGNPQPEVWPNPSVARRVISQYRVMPEFIQTKKKLNQESFMKQRIEKAMKQVEKMRKENMEKAMRMAMVERVGMESVSVRNLNDVAWMIEKNLREIDKKMEAMDKLERVCVPQPPVASDGFMNDIHVRNPQSSSELDHEMSGKQQLLNPYYSLGSAGDEMLQLPFGDINHQNAFLPHILMP